KGYGSADVGTIRLLRRLLFEHGRKHAGAYILAALLMAVGAAATSASAWILKPVLNHMVAGQGFRTLRQLSWAVAALFLLRGLATYGYLVLLSRTGNAIVAEVQRRVFAHLLRQDMKFFQDRHSSEFLTRLSLAANGVRDALQVLVTSVGRDVLTTLGLIVVMVVEDPLMSVIALATLPIAVVSLGRMIRRLRKWARRSFDGSTRIMQTMQETVLGIKIIKSFNLEALMSARMAQSVGDLERAANRIAAGAAISSPLADSLAGLAIAGVIFYGSWRVTIAHADPGSFFAFVAALLMAYQPAKRLARVNLDIQTGLIGARLIYEVLDAPAAEAPAETLPAMEVSEGRIAFENVVFGYRSGELVLDGLTFVAEPNATTALVGPSGGGKSTAIALIQRFYTPEAGRISIDGRDVAGVDLASLRRQIAFVSQDVFLFRGTIRENIALGRPGASASDIEEAARQAHAHDFIISFADAYNTNVGEQGAQLSGGQRQRIAIARAMLKNAPILLLDEPTAALDSESEREVQRALDQLRQGRTTIVVAHRLQTIINADQICVVNSGRLAETGTHAQLLARHGAYHGFFAAQFGEAAGAQIRLQAGSARRKEG
ncbi:MAG TPA: ABC transporter ATP-binding protein, partial [Beijerinckiaceae bacterium]|nr:ABC transporter ATP-binding protein [Beijerinckiaceae bacterium]